MFAPVADGRCSVCGPGLVGPLCSHARAKFNSTPNSKRRVHTMLFWRRLLGPAFPVSDAMLQDAVWRQLGSCDHGIKYVPARRYFDRGVLYVWCLYCLTENFLNEYEVCYF